MSISFKELSSWQCYYTKGVFQVFGFGVHKHHNSK